MDKDVVYIHTGILSTKKNEMIPFAASRIDLESVILSEARQRGEIPCDIPYIWNLK